MIMADEFPELKRAASARRERATKSLRADEAADEADTINLDEVLVKARSKPPVGRTSKPTVEG